MSEYMDQALSLLIAQEKKRTRDVANQNLKLLYDRMNEFGVWQHIHDDFCKIREGASVCTCTVNTLKRGIEVQLKRE